MRYFMLILILGLFLLPTVAQDEALTPYEIALQRIEEARVSGAWTLVLSRLGLTELPPEIWTLSNLMELHLADNQLTSLPPEIANLSSLRVLNLWGNSLASLPSEIGNLRNLSWIDLNYNQLKTLPAELGRLENLVRLHLVGNQLTNLPPEIGNLHRLCLFDLIDNELQYLPSEFSRLEGLKGYYCFITLDGNPLISPPPEVVAQGTAAILDYLHNEAWWHLQRLIAGGAGAVGLVAAVVLGLRWKNRRGYEKKKKKTPIPNPSPKH